MPISSFWNLVVVLFRSFLMIGLTFLTTIAFAEVNKKALEVLEKTSAYYQELENFSAIYNLQVIYSEEDMEQSSKMTITARGQQYRLSYDQKETITDGETVWVYDKEMQEVTISAYAATDSFMNFSELYNLYQQGYTSVYLGERIIKKEKNKIRDIVQLTSASEDNNFASVIFEIDRATSQIHKCEIVQDEGVKYICVMRNFLVNIPLPDDYFTFDVSRYKDLEVIDLRESAEDASLHEETM